MSRVDGKVMQGLNEGEQSPDFFIAELNNSVCDLVDVMRDIRDIMERSDEMDCVVQKTKIKT